MNKLWIGSHDWVYNDHHLPWELLSFHHSSHTANMPFQTIIAAVGAASFVVLVVKFSAYSKKGSSPPGPKGQYTHFPFSLTMCS